MSVDNGYVGIDKLEVPILDGSGQPFVDLIRAAGIKTYRKRKRYLRIRRPVSVEGGGKRITIVPSDRFLLTCEVFFEHPLVARQILQIAVPPARYAKATAPPPTFRFNSKLHHLPPLAPIPPP